MLLIRHCTTCCVVMQKNKISLFKLIKNNWPERIFYMIAFDTNLYKLFVGQIFEKSIQNCEKRNTIFYNNNLYYILYTAILPLLLQFEFVFIKNTI